ncbi:MAG: hypothetical protein IJ767_03865 [Bacteroidaceae bacterium]|nr:hypothetical protein [Bacteroidaceae bacterium]
MNFDSFVREWTRKYKPMRHDERKGNKRFYLTDGLRGLVDFATQTTNALSPSVVMESNQSGYVDRNSVEYLHVLYFFVHAEDKEMSDGEAANRAKKQAVEHMLEFCNYLQQAKENGDPDVRGISSDPIAFDSEGAEQNGWYACQVQFKQTVMRDTCVNQDNYII